MDWARFDSMTKALAGGASRRRVLAGLAGGLAAALGLRRAGAQGCSAYGRVCTQTGCCAGGAECRCYPNGHCRCLCPNGAPLVNGACACPSGTNLCPSTGACLPACTDGQVFNAEACTCGCVATTCYVCNPLLGEEGDGFCSTAHATQEECESACDAAMAGGFGTTFRGGAGETYACAAAGTGCVQTCQ